ncbi:hypothetical protein MPTK1_3g18130 [Marchantia polymorpha subsp. ruderalis]|uniref:VOC domain-containing protein n=2 Tax=Marchantia polymorpha TaxID=3197 RepID=A0AAF6B235_MARPO|nr:hypothetical protein MARPO_0140s0028 [Marchantia polymorpha]BBN06069.1 hypothetical protein Mp_3g18130 [Marchantia polymorpha subsp. ruderalis]|eukprot:PTQ29498.1 hypothetical protein MARPO_0140s0028 [Marchantia polymorpha]
MALPISCVNHISRNCSNLQEASKFYECLLGFVQIKRPGSFDFDGVWLFNYGIGIHLLQASGSKRSCHGEIDPRADHLSFQCAEDINVVEQKLQESGIKYIRRQVQEAGCFVDQLFFHDPDGFMIEVCNCDNLPVEPLVTGSLGISNSSSKQFFPSCSFTPFNSSVPSGLSLTT